MVNEHISRMASSGQNCMLGVMEIKSPVKSWPRHVARGTMCRVQEMSNKSKRLSIRGQTSFYVQQQKTSKNPTQKPLCPQFRSHFPVSKNSKHAAIRFHLNLPKMRRRS